MGHPAGCAGGPKNRICSTLLQNAEQNILEQTLRRVLKEEIRGLQPQKPVEQQNVPDQMLDFLSGL